MTSGSQGRSGWVDIIIGLQFGSEGKGAFCHHLAKQGSYEISVRTGGPQAGHTVMLDSGEQKPFHSLPVAAVVPGIQLVIPPGAVVKPETLLEEIEWCEARGIAVRERLQVDGFATVLRPEHADQEAEKKLRQRIGGTGIGVGAATAARVWRDAITAREVPELADYITDTVELLHRGQHTLLETTQGYGLGLVTSGYYPHCTSREISTSQVLSDCGLPPGAVRHVWGVVRTHPIRVAGDSGPLTDEVTWAQLNREPELTTSTQRERRIGRWETEVVRRAVQVCDLDAAVITFADYLVVDGTLDREENWETIEEAIGPRLAEMQADLGVPVRWVATGFGTIVEVPGGAVRE